jgi:hypothetical protein
MLRPSLSTAAIALLCTGAMAQGDLKSRLIPVTSPVKNAGVYHVATGTWTRNGSIANVTGPDVIYNNTCAVVYFTRMRPTESFQHRSRIPSTSGPTTPSVFYGTAQNDEAPGCHDSYLINGYQISYCSSATTTVDWKYAFANSYAQCGAGDMVPDYVFTVTGLPGGGVTGNQQCWLVDIDLSGNSGGGIVLSADGDGTYPLGSFSTDNQFGFSFSQNKAYATFTGPLIAGDFTWTGGPGTVSGLLTPCTGTDGTIWDNPINLAEEGTGMASNDFFRAAATPGPVSPPSGPGCYYFGGNPHADFWLKLYADPGCAPANPMTEYCFPGEDAGACTFCNPANPPSAHGRGCDNYGQHTGGAHLAASGVATSPYNGTAGSDAGDTLSFISTFENNTGLTVLMQGTATNNVAFGAGRRCVAGTLKRLYIGPAGHAANGDPPGVFHRPGPEPDGPLTPPGTSNQFTVSHNSFVLGYDISAHSPITLFYMAYYRDPLAASTCGGLTFNSSTSGSVLWH